VAKLSLGAVVPAGVKLTGGEVLLDQSMLTGARIVSDIAAFSPGPSSMTSSVTLSMAPCRSSGNSIPEPQKIWRMYSGRESVWGSCAAIRRIC
jgi:hypothetical protein